MPVLTIVYHPDLARVGEVARLDPGSETPLSRQSPGFALPGEQRIKPLGDRCLSRRGASLSFEDGHARMDPGESIVVANGVRVEQACRFSVEEVQEGVVLELFERVVLLLHLAAPVGPGGPRWGLIGESDALTEVRANVARVADLPVPVLLLGESGVGKELVARAIHHASGRAQRPYVCVNIAAMAPSLAPSELFGHVKGAYTGAVRDHRGYFEQADGGTLFLDEIGDTPPEVQPMLLRALEAGDIQPLGAPGARRVDVRLIAATDADLDRAVVDHHFRRPLLHRLAGYELHVPALRERRDDIGRLFFHFLRLELERTDELFRLATIPPERPSLLPTSLIHRLVRHPWPGNVRQLRNAVRQIVISSRGLPDLRPDAAVLRSPTPSGPDTSSQKSTAGPREERELDSSSRGSLPSAEELRVILSRNGWRIGETASQLQISKGRLYSLMEQYPGFRKAKDLSAEVILRQRAESGGDLAELADRLQVSERGLKLRMTELKIL